MKKRIVFFHVLNDFSGSPNVLSLVIKGLVERGYQVDLYTSSVSDGFLSGIKGTNYYRIYYKFSTCNILAALLYILSQIRSFFAVLKYFNEKDTLIYINTILPFGAAIGAKICGLEIIYHVHEYFVRKNVFHKLALAVFLKTADKAFFVSEYLYDCYNLPLSKKRLVFNSLSDEFAEVAMRNTPKLKTPKNILMVCSLKSYKGIDIFVDLAGMLGDYCFTLILNADIESVTNYFNSRKMPQNIKIYPAKTNLHPFYSHAHLVLNLSLPDKCIETFGLTILEAMSYGIPVIAPPIGGITELVDEGFNGFKVDARDHNILIEKIHFILDNPDEYCRMSRNARNKAQNFSCSKMIDKITNSLESSTPYGSNN